MKDDKNYAKMYQIAYVLVSGYGFSTQMIKQYAQFINVELWLLNLNDPKYQIIRITTNKAEDYSQDASRVETIIKAFSSIYRKQLAFLDIHVSDETYIQSLEDHDYLILEHNYSAGTDVSQIYPEIYHAVDDSADPDNEVSRFISMITSAVHQTEKNKTVFRRKTSPVNTVIIVACVIMYLISAYLMKDHPESAVYVFLGADYGTFTRGLHQYWRLFTCAFLHGGIIHLASNMYSLYMIGAYLERMMGKKYYLLSLFVCILTASLTQDILSDNTITLGISGGIYGLLVILITDMLKRKITTVSAFLPLIIVNLMINMLDQTAWIAHIGGLVGGFVMYFFYTEKDKRGPSVLIAVMLLCLFVKYVTMKTISPIYPGTDMQVVRLWGDLGFRDYAEKLAAGLYDVYKVYGG